MVYSFDINNRAFKAIKENKKKVEIRVTKINGIFDYSVIEPNDFIKFSNFDGEKLLVRVKKVNWYASVEELLTVEGTKFTLSSTDDFDEGVRSINSFNGYSEGIKKNGVFAIHIEVVKVCKKILLSDFECVEEISLDDYVRYYNLIKMTMSDPLWLGDFDKNVLEKLLDSGSKIWMFYHRNNFVCSMMGLPASEDDILKFGLNLDYKEVIDYGPMFVSDNYRGNSLQYQMIKKLDDFYKKKGYKYAVSTAYLYPFFL